MRGVIVCSLIGSYPYLEEPAASIFCPKCGGSSFLSHQ